MMPESRLVLRGGKLRNGLIGMKMNRMTEIYGTKMMGIVKRTEIKY